MTTHEFLMQHNASPCQICPEEALPRLLEDMGAGLRGEGNIPMLPSYLNTAISPVPNAECCVLDAGGTNLRSALARFDTQGRCHLGQIHRIPMPGTDGLLSRDAFYSEIAHQVRQWGDVDAIGFCFSYNVLLDRTLDGTLLAWCKEIQVPEAVGAQVGASLARFLEGNPRVHVLNDPVAAMLGASQEGVPIHIGIILGTGINVCYEEQICAIPKISEPLRSDSMIISTEIGEFDGFPKSDFDIRLFSATDEPTLSHAEKQCAGGYLGQLIQIAWDTAAKEGLLGEEYRNRQDSLEQISNALATGDLSPAMEIASGLIHRAAKIAAVLCTGPILRSAAPGSTVNIAVEGSQFYKLTGFRSHFCRELKQILAPHRIRFTIIQSENACLVGAALAAFAQPM